jgi:hypothetical protein
MKKVLEFFNFLTRERAPSMAPALKEKALLSAFRNLFVERDFELCDTPFQNEIFRGATPSVTP